MQTKKSQNKSQPGFTLIELAVVLVIIGLIVGGITVAQDVIVSSKMTALAEQRGRLISASSMFQDKYYSLPGDFKLAEGIWDKLSGSNCDNFNASGLLGGTCSGNGNGKLDGEEGWMFWHHLALSGLFDEEYTGVHSGGTSAIVAGQNTPASPWANNAGWVAEFVGKIVTDATYVDGKYGHVFILGDTSLASTDNGVMTAEQQFSLDNKFDDGQYDTGKILGAKATFVDSCIAGGDYNFAASTQGCAPIWITGF